MFIFTSRSWRWLRILVLAALLFLVWVPVREWYREVSTPSLPEAVSYDAIRERMDPEEVLQVISEEPQVAAPIPIPAQPAPAPIRSSINLAVPFTSQAPYANWDALHNDACEEASVLMVDAYFDGRALNPDGAERELQELVRWQIDRFGYFEDTTAAETAIILREFYGYERVEVLPLADIEEMGNMVRTGVPVIVPAAGRLLGNPYFRGAGPDYHMLVVRGLTEDGKFITNDPGTRRGEAFVYDAAVLWNAIHDWTASSETIEQGAKVMIVVRP